MEQGYTDQYRAIAPWTFCSVRWPNMRCQATTTRRLRSRRRRRRQRTMSTVRTSRGRLRRLIGLDTNILLRATLNDDPGSREAAQRLLKSLGDGRARVRQLAGAGGILLGPAVALQAVPKPRLAASVRDLLGVEYIEFEALEVAWQGRWRAMKAERRISPIMLIALRNRELGAAQHLHVRSKAAAKSIPSMELLA